MARLHPKPEEVAERRDGLQDVDPLDAARPRPGEPVLALQRSAGNAAVARLLSERRQGPAAAAPVTATETSRITLDAVIRRAPGGSQAAAPAAGARDLDAEEGHEAGEHVDIAAVTGAIMATLGEAPEAEEGEKVSLPDMRMPEGLGAIDTDPVAGTITYAHTITQSGAVNPFGATTWANFNVTGATVTSAGGSFVARFTLENPITFNVASDKVSIADENDAALTNTNYPTAASDLTPNMARQGGKPPRTQFWARDLTLRHERFHSNERARLNGAGATQAQTWLSAQTAASVADVQALIAQVPGRVITASQAAVGTLDEKESRAYGDGAASYQARADAIRTKGALGTGHGGYP